MIRGLTVFHVAKAGGLPGPAEGWEQCLGLSAANICWRLETCQRWLLVTQHANSRTGVNPAPLPPGMDVCHGIEAYEFLLEVATGLASQLAGETNILGQMKSAWSHQSARFPWLQWLFADAKEIRTKHLSEVGGFSYGRLVRQLLRHADQPDAGPVLVVGAGDMAETVCPWLRSTPLQILNRTPARAEALAENLHAHPGASVEVVSPFQAERAWGQARAIVVCVPFDPAQDPRRIGWVRAHPANGSPVPVIHLGGHRAQAGAWKSLPGFRCLDDVYALQHQADGHRERQLALAAQACSERAQHRGLGSSLSHPHGWEDLPAFFPFTGLQPSGLGHARRRRQFAPEALAA